MFGLEFGCGETPRKKDFFGVDVRPGPTVKYLCNAWEIDQHVSPNSVDAIFSRHFFEHLTFAQGRKTLEVWHKILKPGGEMEMILPDMDFHVKQWLNPNRESVTNKNGMTDLDWALSGFWGQQRDGLTEVWDVHKSGYDFDLLKKTLCSAGYTGIVRQNSAPKNLHIKCWKNNG
jgi:predicted SAM-dependent methyltransferase